MEKLYVLLMWFWEGDSYLVNEYKGVFSDITKIPDRIKSYTCKWSQSIYTDDNINTMPQEIDGGYNSDVFYTFTEIKLNEEYCSSI